jgi:hypothetical protein
MPTTTRTTTRTTTTTKQSLEPVELRSRLKMVNFCVQIMLQKVAGSETNQACGLAIAHDHTRWAEPCLCPEATRQATILSERVVKSPSVAALYARSTLHATMAHVM